MSITSSTGTPTTATAAPTPGIWPVCVHDITVCITRARLGITGNADDPHGLVFTDHYGRVMTPAAVARPPTGPPPPPSGRYQHPLGERLQMRWVHFNPPRPPAPTDTN